MGKTKTERKAKAAETAKPRQRAPRVPTVARDAALIVLGYANRGSMFHAQRYGRDKAKSAKITATIQKLTQLHNSGKAAELLASHYLLEDRKADRT